MRRAKLILHLVVSLGTLVLVLHDHRDGRPQSLAAERAGKNLDGVALLAGRHDLGLTRTAAIQSGIDDDAMKPSRKLGGAVGSPCRRRHPDFQQRFLKNLVRIGGIARHAPGESKNARAKFVAQRSEGLLIAGGDPRDQSVVAQFNLVRSDGIHGTIVQSLGKICLTRPLFRAVFPLLWDTKQKSVQLFLLFRAWIGPVAA